MRNNLKSKEDVKICTYVICKNELKHVRNWLTRVWCNGKGSDYICVLDTGSTDGTFEELLSVANELSIPDSQFIIKRKEYDFFRFDTARNDSIDIIPTDVDIDVCFCVDLDEYVEEDFWDDLRSTVFEHPDFERIYYKYAQKLVDNSPSVIFWYDKIHSTGEWLWKQPVHELLVRKDGNECKRAFKMSADKIYLIHHQDPSKNRDSYIKLLKLREEENDGDPYGSYYLGMHLMQVDRDAEALPYFIKCISYLLETSDGLHTISPAYCRAANCFTTFGELDVAEHLFKKAIETDPSIGMSYIYLAQLYAYSNRPQDAYDVLDSFHKNAIKKDMWYEEPWVWSHWKECQIIGDALCWEEKYAEALEYFKTAEAYILTDEDRTDAIEHHFYLDYDFVCNKVVNK